jgi:hypothetical protein
MKYRVTFLLVPLFAVCAWAQQAPPAPASTPQSPGSMGANSTTDKANAPQSKTTSGKDHKRTSNSQRNAGSNRNRTKLTSGK